MKAYKEVISNLVFFNYLGFSLSSTKRKLYHQPVFAWVPENYVYIHEALGFYKKYEGEKFILGQYNEVPEIVKVIMRGGKSYVPKTEAKTEKIVNEQQKLHREKHRALPESRRIR